MENRIELKSGDIFVSRSHSRLLDFFITRAQKAIAFDSLSFFTHAGIIVNKEGKTFESGIKIEGLSGFRIGYQNLYENYEGVSVRVLRHREMTPDRFQYAFAPLSRTYNRKPYPIWRLPFFLVPSVARKLKLTSLGVCSEIAAKLLYNLNLIPQWRSVFPDMLSDWGHSVWGKKGFTIIWEGTIGCTDLLDCA